MSQEIFLGRADETLIFLQLIITTMNHLYFTEPTVRTGSSQRARTGGSPAGRRQQQEGDRIAALRDQFGVARISLGPGRTQGRLGGAFATLGGLGGAVDPHRDPIDRDRGEEQTHRHCRALQATPARHRQSTGGKMTLSAYITHTYTHTRNLDFSQGKQFARVCHTEADNRPATIGVKIVTSSRENSNRSCKNSRRRGESENRAERVPWLLSTCI